MDSPADELAPDTITEIDEFRETDDGTMLLWSRYRFDSI